MTSEIHLGYEVGTGNPITIPLRHMAVTGQTQESGKTTTLEALITRSKLRAVAYVTKRGESSFHVANPIPPYFQERADWQFVQSLLEAAMERRMDFKEPWIMRASDGASTLEEVRTNITRYLHGVKEFTVKQSSSGRGLRKKKLTEATAQWVQKPARGLERDVYYVLGKYFDEIMPQIQNLPYTKTLELTSGVNVMDLRDYQFPLQALVIRSVIDYIRQHEKNTINVIPEAWKFAPKVKGSPVRHSAEELIREGGALKNFLWIDSQDLAGVADVLMRQVGVWIFGVQRAKHEIERALDHMPEGLPVRRPRSGDIATLDKGQFYVCFGREMYKVYVQPAWMSAAHAEAIARGEEEVESAREILRDFAKEQTHGEGAGATLRGRALDRYAEPREERKPTNEGNQAIDSQSPETISLSAMSGQGTDADRDRSASDCGARDRRSAANGHDYATAAEETMWKEKFDALLNEHEQLKIHFRELQDQYVALAKQKSPAAADPNGEGLHASPSSPGLRTAAAGLNNGDFEKIWKYVKLKAHSDPAVLVLLRQQPEIEVKIERKIVEAHVSTLRGFLATLIAEKFFDLPKNGNQAFAEVIRRGRRTAKPNVYRELDGLAELGFLTKEEAGYQAVPQMKINVVEA